MVLSILGPARWRPSHLHRVVALGITLVSLSNTFTGFTYSHVCRFGVRCSHSGSIGYCAGPPAHQPFIYIPRATTTTMLLVLLPPPSRCCQVRGRGRGRWGECGVGNGSARRVGRPPRRRGSGHDKMFSWDAGCQRGLPVPNALKAQKKTASHCSSTRRPARANSSGLLLDSEDEQGYVSSRSIHTFAVSLHVSVKKH